MTDIVIDKAGPKDNLGICELCKIPMTGNISLSIGVDPDCFTNAGIQNEIIELFVCRKESRIIGLFSVGKSTVYYDGKPSLVRYLSDLRISPDFQKSLLLIQITRYIKTHVIADNEFAFAVVFSENKIMTDMIAKVDQASVNNGALLKKASLPKFNLRGNYCSYMISLDNYRTISKSELLIRRAKTSDVGDMLIFFNREASKKQLYPSYDFSHLHHKYYHGLSISDFYLAIEDGLIVGITGIWDQRGFKQTSVSGYSQYLKFARPLINILASISKGFNLPKAGEALNYFTLHTVLTKNNNPKIFRAIIEHIYKDYYRKEFRYFLCGLDKNDALSTIFSDFKKREVHGNLYSVSFDYSRKTLMIPNFYVEAARI